MPRVADFDDFYASTQRLTLAVTYAKCGDRQVARDATVTAYQTAWVQWGKLTPDTAAGFVRDEAWKATALSRGTHPLRRRDDDGVDPALLAALGDLDQDSRRLVALMTIANLDLDLAAREVGVGDEEALELASRGFSRLEETLGASIDEVVTRVGELAGVTAGLPLPGGAAVRRSATRMARVGTALVATLAVVLTVVGGALLTTGDATARQTALPDREKIGAESRDIVLDSHNIGTDDLLSLEQVSVLQPQTTWSIEGTDTDATNTTPYATCPTTRFADPDPLKVFVRAYADDAGNRVAQSIEVSRTEGASENAFRRLVAIYAGCEHPRTRLVDAYRVERPFGDFDILRLQSYRDPARFITVGLAQSGALTSTLVHEAIGTTPTDVEQFASVLNASVGRVCADSGGDCTRQFEVTRVLPPAAAEHPQFLGVVDLPPVDTVDSVWSASDPMAITGDNPAATLCDNASFTGPNVREAAVRLFAIPEATVLPDQFALTQTVGRMTDAAYAKKFVDVVSAKVKKCPDGDLPTRVDQQKKASGEGFTGRSWRIGVEVGKDQWVYYRMGIVRRGDAVTQLLFPPAGDYAISAGEFRAVLQRAGERLAYATP